MELVTFLALVLLFLLPFVLGADTHTNTHPHQKKEIVLSSGVKCELDYVSTETTANSKGSILLLHGSKFDADTWVETGTLAFLAENGYHAFAINLPGWGSTTKLSSKDVPRDFLKSVMEALGITKPALISPSMSGHFSIPFVEAYTFLLSSFIPVAPVFPPKFEEDAQIMLPALVVWGSLDLSGRSSSRKKNRLLSG